MCRGSFSLGSITRRMQNLIIKSSKQQVEWMVASATAVCPQNLCLQPCGELCMERGLVPAVPAWPRGSWAVAVAAACSGDPWGVGGTAAHLCLLCKRGKAEEMPFLQRRSLPMA